MILSRPRNNLESKKVNIPELDSQVAGLRVWHPEEKRRDLIKKRGETRCTSQIEEHGSHLSNPNWPIRFIQDLALEPSWV
jgi:hypothetical protein